jgi:hypothetical protein
LGIGDWGSVVAALGRDKFLIGRGRLLEALCAAGGEQGPHLGDGDVVEGGEAFGLRQTLADEHGVEAFEVGEDDEGGG